MHIHRPCLVLVPDTFVSTSDATLASGGKRPSTTSLLVQCILEEFEGVPVEPVLRKYWSDSAGESLPTTDGASHVILAYLGLEFISQLCVGDDERAATLVAVSNKYCTSPRIPDQLAHGSCR